MDLMDVMRQAQGGNAIANLARTYGAQPAQVEAVMERIVPLLAQRIERNTLSRGGLADTVEIIGHRGYQAVLDTPAAFANPDVRMAGNDLLEQILGGKDASRKLAAQAAFGSGISESIIKMMLPYIVQMVLGGLGRQLSGGLGDILSKIPNLGGGAGGGAGDGGHTTGGGFPQMPQSQPFPQQQSPFPFPMPQQTGGPAVVADRSAAAACYPGPRAWARRHAIPTAICPTLSGAAAAAPPSAARRCGASCAACSAARSASATAASWAGSSACS